MHILSLTLDPYRACERARQESSKKEMARNYLYLSDFLCCTIGFDISDFGNNTIIINGCPSDIPNPNPKVLIEILIEEYKNTRGDIKINAKERIARSLAKVTL